MSVENETQITAVWEWMLKEGIRGKLSIKLQSDPSISIACREVEPDLPSFGAETRSRSNRLTEVLAVEPLPQGHLNHWTTE
jgi:hypothetical protein